MADRIDHINVAALDTRVTTLDNEMGDINARISRLDEKFDRVMTAFAGEFRAAISSLSVQFSERNKTPWGILISGAGVILTMVALLGHQALAPITENLGMAIHDMVPRKEIEFRHAVTDHRLIVLEQTMMDMHKNEYERLKSQLEALQRENNLLKYPVKP